MTGQQELVSLNPPKARLNFHLGQQRTWYSQRRWVLMLAGTQSGKTSFGPWWLAREIDRSGPGDYLAVTATFDLFKLKMLPELLYVFETILRRGRYWAGDRIIEIPDPEKGFLATRSIDPMWARIILRSANAPGGLESATAKAAWLDEAGQPSFTLEAWQAVRRRLSLSRGRTLLTTTPFTMGWLKQQVYDRWKKGDPHYDVIQFASILNPRFSVEEFDEARATLPGWKFNMFYRGLFDRPAGQIYGSFDSARHTCPRFKIPSNWPRYWGLDMGGVNTAVLFYAEQPQTGRLYLYREYWEGEKTVAKHVESLLEGEIFPRLVVGGSLSENDWRWEYAAAGLPVEPPPIGDVELGIDRVYGAHAKDDIIVFDDLEGYLDQKATYQRRLDDQDHPTTEIENKSRFHFMDAERYLMAHLFHKRRRKRAGAWGRE